MSVSDTPRNRGNADAPHMSPVTPAEDVRSIAINDISWGAVLAGVVVALVAQLILNMIGIGVGASTLDPGAGPNENPSAQGFSIGAGIWWTVSGIVAALAGGYVAGRLSGKPKPSKRRTKPVEPSGKRTAWCWRCFNAARLQLKKASRAA